ncbi:MAG: 6-pyruvoyl-tetrahydropterin synthase-related protein [Anaerolineae bacterium]
MSSVKLNVKRLTFNVSRLTQYLFSQFDTGIPLAALLTLFISQSLFQPGLPTLADLPIHLYRTLEYGQAWSTGVIIPRWAPNLAYGYGYPLFVFAPPLPYWLTLLFQLPGLTLETAFKILIIVTILLYAIGMYLFTRDLLHSIHAGLIAATAFAFAPFALREALLYGGNIPQYLAIALFPWTLWAMLRAVGTCSWGWAVTTACFFAGILLSHLFQALIFAPVAGGFGLILSVTSNQRAIFLGHGKKSINLQSLISLTSPQFLTVIPLGLLLAAFFWLPAFTERTFTRAQAEIYLTKSPFFVRYPHPAELLAWIQPLDARAANPYVPLSLGVVTLTLAALGLTVVIGNWLLIIKSPTRNSITNPIDLQSPISNYQLPIFLLFFTLVAGVATFMTISPSRLVWETVSILQVAEFPWRMLGPANLGLAVLAGAAILWIPPKWRWPVTVACLIVQIWAVAPLLYPVTPFTRYGQPSVADQVEYERRSQTIGTTTLGEYLPQTVEKPPTDSRLAQQFTNNSQPERLDRDSLPGGATAVLLHQNAVTHRYLLDTPSPFTLRLWQFDYPGWQADLNGQPARLWPEKETGFILVDIPAGQHTLTIHFGETPTRLFSLGLTGFTLLALIIFGLFQFPTTKSSRSIPQLKSPSPASLHLRAPAVIAGTILLITTALWIKPLLRPAFTLNSPPDQALPAQHQTRIDFTNGVQLIGYDLAEPIVRAGNHASVVLYWQTTTAPLQANLQPFVHLDRLHSFTTVADSTNYTPGDATTESVLPTFHWDTSRYVRDQHDLIIPADTPPLAYALRVGLLDPDRQNQLVPLVGGGDTAQVTIVNVTSNGALPKLAQPLQISFAANHAKIQLVGFELGQVSASELAFTLAWQTDQPLTTNYTVFAQLLTADNKLVASFDRPPLDGAYPTSTWLAGQVILDPRHIPLTQVPPGEYRLIVGLYDPSTQQRLQTTNQTDFVELTPVQLDQP